MTTNYHTHTVFCDGRAEAVCFADEAVKLKMAALGFSAHAPVDFPASWTMNPARVGEYYEEIHRLKREYAGRVDIFCGLEADFLPDIHDRVRALYAGYRWDYIIGSVHLIGLLPGGGRWCIDGSHEEFRKGWREVTDSDPLLPVKIYFDYTRDMVRTMKPDIIGHMDKIKIQYRPDCLIPDTHPFFREQVMNTLEEIAASNCIVEVSTRGMMNGQINDYYPGRRVIEDMFRMKIPVTVNSDAHSPDGLTFGFDKAEKMLKEIGYRTVMALKNGTWEERPI